VRIKLLWALAFCALMCGTAVADPIVPYTCTGTGFTTLASCGIAADWVYPGQATAPTNGSIIPYPGPDTVPYPGAQTVDPGSYLAGAVMFRSWTDTNGVNWLTVSLSNISNLDTMEPGFGLTAVLFDITGGGEVTEKVSALMETGSTLENYGTCSSGGCGTGGPIDVGMEFAYRHLPSEYTNGPNLFDDNTSNGSGGPRYGISSSGLSKTGVDDGSGWFSGSNLFTVPVPCNGQPGSSLDKPCSPDGPNFDIVSYGDNPATGNGGVSGNPQIKPGDNGAVIFTFKTDRRIPISEIHNVLFQYGTGTDHLFSWPDCVGTSGELNARPCTNTCPDCENTEVPEPASLILVGSGFLGLAGFLRRRLT